MSMFYTLRGKIPVMVADMERWAQWMETGDRIVKQETINGIRVSTVFLGLDHGIGIGREPLLFETMIFRNGEGKETWRYSTWEQAETGHVAAVELVRREQLKVAGT